MIADRAGAIDPGGWQGVYHRDVRVLSGLLLTLDGRALRLLSVHRDGANAVTRVHGAAAGESGSVAALLTRRMEVGGAVRETLE
ncbi:MAG: glycogen debranching N-terminal domain-containing protein, partial [Egibacteraceae bacterium]